MDRIMDEKNSLIKFTCPVMVIDENGRETGATMPGEMRSKILQGKTTESELLYMEKILDQVVPPREWNEEGVIWRQHLSSEIASRMHILRVRGKLDNLLKERLAKPYGLCIVRRELYTQLFDELIRQEVVTMPERGLLLLRIRDEMRMTLAAFKTLYDDSLLYSTTKQSEINSMIALQEEVSALQKEVNELKKTLNKLKSEMEHYVRNLIEFKEKSDWIFKVSVSDLNNRCRLLKSQLNIYYSMKDTALRSNQEEY